MLAPTSDVDPGQATQGAILMTTATPLSRSWPSWRTTPSGKKVTRERSGPEGRDIRGAPHTATGQRRGPSISAGCVAGQATGSASVSSRIWLVEGPAVKSDATTLARRQQWQRWWPQHNGCGGSGHDSGCGSGGHRNSSCSGSNNDRTAATTTRPWPAAAARRWWCQCQRCGGSEGSEGSSSLSNTV